MVGRIYDLPLEELARIIIDGDDSDAGRARLEILRRERAAWGVVRKLGPALYDEGNPRGAARAREVLRLLWTAEDEITAAEIECDSLPDLVLIYTLTKPDPDCHMSRVFAEHGSSCAVCSARFVQISADELPQMFTPSVASATT